MVSFHRTKDISGDLGEALNFGKNEINISTGSFTWYFTLSHMYTFLPETIFQGMFP